MTDTPRPEPMSSRSVFVSIVGRPNVGKSSLLNAILQEKVAIVSDKPQTTRTKITGVLTQNETQMVFIDTPGLHKGKTKLSAHMVKAVGQAIGDVDVSVLVTEPSGPIREAEEQLLADIGASGAPAILCVNKIDTVDNKEQLLARAAQFTQKADFAAVFFISATQRDGVDDLIAALKDYAVESPHFFPDDALTDQPERVIVSEIVREKILRNMFEEIPHGTAVVVEKFKERPGQDLVDIDCTVYCERQSHKGMIIGKQGSMLKIILSQSRQDIEQFLGCRVNLQCWVKVKEDWRNKEGLIKNFGLVEE